MKVNTYIDVRPGELRCPRCVSRDLVPSMPRGWWDDFMRRRGRIPRHCRFCGKRFHARIEDIAQDAALREEEEKIRGPFPNRLF